MTSRRPIHNKFVSKLAVDTEFGSFLGDTRIRLLESIDRYGSISQAAKAVPLSYKAAWDAVDVMNNLADQPLVERSVGGRHGGGTALTSYGRRLVAMYRAVEQEYQDAIDRLSARLGEAGEGDMADFQSMLRRMSMKTSARNQFVGPVTSLQEGAVNFEVTLRLDPQTQIVANITRESAETMDLRIGQEIHAFVKSSSVMVMTDPLLKISARNQLWGKVERIRPGAVNDEVTIILEGGRTVTAIVTQDSVRTLGLAPGVAACALFKASSVILANFD